MSLEEDEIQQLILLLDPTATGRDIDRYVDETGDVRIGASRHAAMLVFCMAPH